MFFYISKTTIAFISSAMLYLISVLGAINASDRVHKRHNLLVFQKNPRLNLLKNQIQEDDLGKFALTMIGQTKYGKNLSPIRQKIVARTIVRIATEIFTDPVHRKEFIIVLKLESSFNPLAQSPTGPRGMSQLAKNGFKDGMKVCNIKESDVNIDEDIFDVETNVLVGACYFRHMIELSGGDSRLALIKYNQGPSSEDAKLYKNGKKPKTAEATEYIRKFEYIVQNGPHNLNKMTARSVELGRDGNEVD